jgi:hypothetical protein
MEFDISRFDSFPQTGNKTGTTTETSGNFEESVPSESRSFMGSSYFCGMATMGNYRCLTAQSCESLRRSTIMLLAF